MVFYVYAVIGLEVFRGLLAADPDYQDENPEAHFATPFNAFLTLFQVRLSRAGAWSICVCVCVFSGKGRGGRWRASRARRRGYSLFLLSQPDRRDGSSPLVL